MKVLMVLNNLRVANGVATTIMNQYDALIEAGICVDFMVFLQFESPYIEKINKCGGQIFLVNRDKSAIKNMSAVLKNQTYDIVHINQVNAETVQLAMIAHHYKVKKVIFHSHNTRIPGGIKRRVLENACNIVYGIFADARLACSVQAGKDSFGKKSFVVLKNSIDAQKFAFDRNQREKIRRELGVDNQTLVVGTVCRYARQKNPIFMIDIIKELINLGLNVRFLWVGSAPSDDDPVFLEMKKKVRDEGIENNMLWVGSKTDVYNWYSAMDVFLMPSLWEGLGITYIEAQANSLPTFASDVVPQETKITELISFLPLKQSAYEWAAALSKYPVRGNEVQNYLEEIQKSGYDLKLARHDLLNIYRNMIEI